MLPRLVELYRARKLAQGYPGLERLAVDSYAAAVAAEGDRSAQLTRRLMLFDRLVDLSAPKSILVLGCGPRPQAIKLLLERGYEVVGVEPVAGFAEAARAYLGSTERVLVSTAEQLPLESCSQDLIFCDSVLEHVTSPTRSLDEMHRVLRPGGAAFISTTNRWRLSPTGRNDEYRVRGLQWLPAIVKECFVFHHLHYDPSLANHSLRPAVHWFSYADLCELGRRSGFDRFYSTLDLSRPEDPTIRRSRIKRRLLTRVKLNPWLRAVALTQLGDTIIMLKELGPRTEPR